MSVEHATERANLMDLREACCLAGQQAETAGLKLEAKMMRSVVARVDEVLALLDYVNSRRVELQGRAARVNAAIKGKMKGAK